MKETAREERTGVLVGLGLLLAAGSAVLLRNQVVLAVSPAVLLGLFIPAATFSILLKTHQQTWGREGRYLDLWSIPHFLLGVFAFLLGIDLVYVLAVAVAWELIELVARVHEYPTNRVVDVVLAVAGWVVLDVARVGA